MWKDDACQARSLVHMSYPRFVSLLEAGMRWRIRDQQLALSASAFPHLSEKAQKDLLNSLQEMLDVAQEREIEDNTDTIRSLRDLARLKLAMAGTK